jgi:hypothetical protein
MVKWNRIFSNEVGVAAVKEFAQQNMSIEDVQRHFRIGKDRVASGQIRKLIRTHGASLSRRIARKSLRRRGLMD